MHPDDLGYYTVGKKAELDWPVEDPKPTVLSTDPTPLDALEQRNAFKLLMRFAVKEGWEVRAGYSLGLARAVKKGTYKTMHTWGLWGRGYGWRWCAMYEWSPDLKKDWAWASTAMWRTQGGIIAPGLGTRFVHANITDLRQWLSLNGGTGSAWYKAVNARVEEQKAREKARAASATKKAKEGAS